MKFQWVSAVNAKGRTYYYSRHPSLLGIPRTKLANDPARAQEEVLRMAADRFRKMPVAKYLTLLVAAARQRAKLKGLPHSLHADDVVRMLIRQDLRCALSRLPFDLAGNPPADLFKRPFAPSIDRIDCALGYESGNIRIVCRIVNFGMSSWGYDALRKAACAIAKADPMPLESFATASESLGRQRVKIAKVLQSQLK